VNFGLSDNTIDRLHEVFRRYDEVEEVIIYGSRAKGNFRNGSDIDIIVKGNRINRKIMSSIWQDIEDLNFPYKVDLSDFQVLNTPDLSDHIERVGKVIYRKI
jgi:predicted nucleotidyltransferase